MDSAMMHPTISTSVNVVVMTGIAAEDLTAGEQILFDGEKVIKYDANKIDPDRYQMGFVRDDTATDDTATLDIFYTYRNAAMLEDFTLRYNGDTLARYNGNHAVTAEIYPDYLDQSNKPSINGVELIGNKTTADLKIEASTNYDVLENKPHINGVALVGNKSTSDLGIPEFDPKKLTIKQDGAIIAEYDTTSSVEFDIPKADVPTMQALTISQNGETKGVYDGTAAVDVNIEATGGGGNVRELFEGVAEQDIKQGDRVISRVLKETQQGVLNLSDYIPPKTQPSTKTAISNPWANCMRDCLGPSPDSSMVLMPFNNNISVHSVMNNCLAYSKLLAFGHPKTALSQFRPKPIAQGQFAIFTLGTVDLCELYFARYNKSDDSWSSFTKMPMNLGGSYSKCMYYGTAFSADGRYLFASLYTSNGSPIYFSLVYWTWSEDDLQSDTGYYANPVAIVAPGSVDIRPYPGNMCVPTDGRYVACLDYTSRKLIVFDRQSKARLAVPGDLPAFTPSYGGRSPCDSIFCTSDGQYLFIIGPGHAPVCLSVTDSGVISVPLTSSGVPVQPYKSILHPSGDFIVTSFNSIDNASLYGLAVHYIERDESGVPVSLVPKHVASDILGQYTGTPALPDDICFDPSGETLFVASMYAPYVFSFAVNTGTNSNIISKYNGTIPTDSIGVGYALENKLTSERASMDIVWKDLIEKE